jgi:putative heme-binding domain-containing protein
MRLPVLLVRTNVLVSLSMMFALGLPAQTAAPPPRDEPRNPLTSDVATIKQGAVLFRQECRYCHGPGARGGARGPDLTTGSWSHGGSDAELRRTISTGVPGTGMPANHLTDDEIWQIVAYLRTLQVPVVAPGGDPSRGEKIFFGDGNCSLCHMVSGRGGRLGPELTRVGSARPRAYLTESIREPDRQLAHNRNFSSDGAFDYDTVIAVTRQGQTITGVPLNEDTFTVQLMDVTEKIYSFQKKSLKSFRHERKSQMPAYTKDSLSDEDLHDLVAYLQTLRAQTPKPEGGPTHASE